MPVLREPVLQPLLGVGPELVVGQRRAQPDRQPAVRGPEHPDPVGAADHVDRERLPELVADPDRVRRVARAARADQQVQPVATRRQRQRGPPPPVVHQREAHLEPRAVGDQLARHGVPLVGQLEAPDRRRRGRPVPAEHQRPVLETEPVDLRDRAQVLVVQHHTPERVLLGRRDEQHRLVGAGAQLHRRPGEVVARQDARRALRVDVRERRAAADAAHLELEPELPGHLVPLARLLVRVLGQLLRVHGQHERAGVEALEAPAAEPGGGRVRHRGHREPDPRAALPVDQRGGQLRAGVAQVDEVDQREDLQLQGGLVDPRGAPQRRDQRRLVRGEHVALVGHPDARVAEERQVRVDGAVLDVRGLVARGLPARGHQLLELAAPVVGGQPHLDPRLRAHPRPHLGRGPVQPLAAAWRSGPPTPRCSPARRRRGTAAPPRRAGAAATRRTGPRSGRRPAAARSPAGRPARPGARASPPAGSRAGRRPRGPCVW